MIYPMVIAHARRHGLPLAEVQGSHMPDYLRLNVDGGGQKFFSAQFGQRLAADTLEFMARNTPRWAAGLPQCYNLRERGSPPPWRSRSAWPSLEAPSGTCSAGDRHRRCGAAPSLGLHRRYRPVRGGREVPRTPPDVVEDDARGVRREGDPQHAAANRLPHLGSLAGLPAGDEQRHAGSVQTLAAILGGVQSVETCTYDEPISIPTPEARELATFTQLILAHEVGAARTAIRSGGLYVESLTDEVERRATSCWTRSRSTGSSRDRGRLARVADGRRELPSRAGDPERGASRDRRQRIPSGGRQRPTASVHGQPGWG